ncbi:MAG TPA: LPS export ABC transporter permease LptF [Candidatus Binatia bacterium]|jgi:lipopolysaccharide export system permease protein
MGRTLKRYVLREVSAAFVAAVSLAVSVLFVLRIVEFVDLAFARGVPARLVGALAGFIVPSYLEVAIPMGALLAVVVVFARLGSDGELLALRASGLALGQLAAPLVTFSIAIAVVSLLLGVWARPWANRGIDSTTYQMARTRLTASLREGVFNTWFGGVILFVDQLDAKSGTMHDVMLAEEREEFGRKTIFASDGRVESNEDARTAYLALTNGSLLTYHPSGKYQDKTDFDSLEMNLDLGEDEGLDPMSHGGPPAMSLQALLDLRREHLEHGESPIEEDIELQRKLVLPAAALLLPFIGVPLGAMGRRGVKSRGLLLSTIIVLLYYLALTVSVTLAREQVVPTPVAMWLPDAMLAMLAVALYRRAASESRTLVPAWLPGLRHRA